jgi:hypothetical protein
MTPAFLLGFISFPCLMVLIYCAIRVLEKLLDKYSDDGVVWPDE